MCICLGFWEQSLVLSLVVYHSSYSGQFIPHLLGTAQLFTGEKKHNWSTRLQEITFTPRRMRTPRTGFHFHFQTMGSCVGFNWNCSSSNSWYSCPPLARGMPHCWPACFVSPLWPAHRPGPGKVSPHCPPLWPRSPGSAYFGLPQIRLLFAWEPLFSLPGQFYSLC